MTTQPMDPAEMKTRLIDWIRGKMPQAEDLTISDIDKPGVGLSNETCLFDIIWKESGEGKIRPVVLRKEPVTAHIFPEYDLYKQYKIMELLKDTDVPISTVFWFENNTDIVGTPFFLMDRIIGQVPSDFPPYVSSGFFFEATPKERKKMWMGGLEVVANVHRADWEKLGFSFLGVPGGGTDPIDKQLAYWENFLNWVKDDPDESHPLIEAAVKWLKENKYEPEQVALCWGDPKMANLMFDEDYNVALAMDWEMAYISDPESDLSFYYFVNWLHTTGDNLPVPEGIPEREETNRYWEERTGLKVKNLFYNDVLAAYRFGLILISIYKGFKKQGVSLPEDMEHNNAATRRIAQLLELPSPAGPEAVKNLDEMTVTAQMHFTGSGGSDWYLVSDKGKVTRHEGIADNPYCTITVSVEDWQAIQDGSLKFQDAWTSARCKVDGSTSMMLRLKDTIVEYSLFE